MFKEFTGKPIQRMAHLITDADKVTKVKGQEATFKLKSGKEEVVFKAYETPKVGDYVVYITDEDTYHVTAEVFAERNYTNTEDIPVDATLVEELTKELAGFKEANEDLIEALKIETEANLNIMTLEEINILKSDLDKALAHVKNGEEEIEQLKNLNDALGGKVEELVTPINDLPDVEYDPELEADMDCRQAEAAARAGQAFTRKSWHGAYMTYDKKTKSYIWHRKHDGVGKPSKLVDEQRAPKDFKIFVVA